SSLRHPLALSSHRHPAHPDLHPFPTRRSSDLATARSASRTCWRWVAITPPSNSPPRRVSASGYLASSSMTWRDPVNRFTGSRRRSEEHTSELQSRFDLVCRLLLEKKKKTT